MDNALIMDVSGAWVRRPGVSSGVSSVEQMNAWADERERLFLARHSGNPNDFSDIGPDIGPDAGRARDRQHGPAR